MTPLKTFLSVFAAIVTAALLIYGILEVRIYQREQATLRSIEAEMQKANDDLLRVLEEKSRDPALVWNDQARHEILMIALEARKDAFDRITELRNKNAPQSKIQAATEYSDQLTALYEKIKSHAEEVKAKDEERAAKERAEMAEAEKKRIQDTEQVRRKQLAEEAEREKARRFAPEGTVYNILAVSVSREDGMTTIPPGTELMMTRRNEDGTLRVEIGPLIANVSADSVTNDRDLAASARSDYDTKQDEVRKWNAQQAVAAAKKALIMRYRNIKDDAERLRYLESLSPDDQKTVLLGE